MGQAEYCIVGIRKREVEAESSRATCHRPLIGGDLAIFQRPESRDVKMQSGGN